MYERYKYICVMCFFFFRQKTAYELRISDWSSDVCSSDLWFASIGFCTWNPLRKPMEANHEHDRLRPDPAAAHTAGQRNQRSEERRVGKDVSVRVDLGGRRIIKQNKRVVYSTQIADKICTCGHINTLIHSTISYPTI